MDPLEAHLDLSYGIPMSDRIRLEMAIEQIKSARGYSQLLFNDIPHEEWFLIPEGSVTHIGWQVGHLAVAQYGLTMFRQRDRLPSDRELFDTPFRKQFGKGSVPVAGEEANPTPAELLATLDRVHNQALEELAENDGSRLDEPCDMPYAGYPTKLGALLFCPAHEMMHAGQIGMLRRMLGRDPIR